MKEVYNWPFRILSGLFPPTCLLCGAPGTGDLDLCAGCLEDLPWNRSACVRCALPLPPASPPGSQCGVCLRTPPPYHSCIAPLRYDAVVPYLVAGLKFNARMAHARLLGELLTLALMKECLDPWPQLIIPIPLHPLRQRERGFNQALEIARGPACRLGITLDTGLCQRVRRTAPQSGLHARERRRNLRNAFVLSRPPQAEHVAILDDVVTTGNTVSELARILRRAGVRRVDVWASARTPNPG